MYIFNQCLFHRDEPYIYIYMYMYIYIYACNTNIDRDPGEGAHHVVDEIWLMHIGVTAAWLLGWQAGWQAGWLAGCYLRPNEYVRPTNMMRPHEYLRKTLLETI
jgi:hypothetical protein